VECEGREITSQRDTVDVLGAQVIVDQPV